MPNTIYLALVDIRNIIMPGNMANVDINKKRKAMNRYLNIFSMHSPSKLKLSLLIITYPTKKG